MPKAMARNVLDYSRLAQDAHARVCQMEGHLKALVTEKRMEQARVIEDEHRIVPASTEGNPSSFQVVQGEAWICERVAISVPGATSGTVYIYRDVIAPNRLAEVCVLDANGNYADSFGNRLYLPERTKLIAQYVGAANNVTVFFNIQLRALKRHLNKLTNEEVHAMDSPGSAWDAQNTYAETDNEGEPHDERHGNEEFKDDGLGGDILPPVPEETNRPQPHFRVGQAIEHAVEEVVEFFEEVL